MRITTKITWDIETLQVLEHDYFEYGGEVALCGGSHADPMQTQAAQSNIAISKQAADTAAKENARQDEQYGLVKPFYTERLANGLSYAPQLFDAQSGLVARSFAPAFQNLSRRFASDGLPSGSRDAAFRSLDAEKARATDAQILQGLQLNDAARQDAAAGLVGQQGLALNAALGNQNSALQGNAGVMNATTLTHTNGLAGVLGGLFGGVGSALVGKIPFGGSGAKNG